MAFFTWKLFHGPFSHSLLDIVVILFLCFLHFLSALEQVLWSLAKVLKTCIKNRPEAFLIIFALFSMYHEQYALYAWNTRASETWSSTSHLSSHLLLYVFGDETRFLQQLFVSLLGISIHRLRFLRDCHDVLHSVGLNKVLVAVETHERLVCSGRYWWFTM